MPHRVLAWFDALPREEKFERAGHRLGGQNKERQSIGLPGHCAICAVFGHVVAHPEHGCVDVSCTLPAADHGPATAL
ncbi:hypothetical protein AXK58_13655 [Tsukamurella tyrosinosolvens]|nr:hypothetical protein AXK58_13655 [Tsukamurella tyrosinosolvens]